METAEGVKIKPQVSIGDIVLFTMEGPGVISIDFERKDYVILLGDDYVLGIIRKEKHE